MFEHITTLTVRYCETDRMGIVHHSNYLRYLEQARTEFMRAAGYAYSDAERDGILIPVVSAELHFLSPCTFEDVLEIRTSVASFKGARLVMEYVITCGERTILRGTTSHAMTNRELRPINIRNTCPRLYEVFTQSSDKEKA